MDSDYFKDIDNLKLGKPAVGKLLISEPFLPDPEFSRSVILLTEHDNEGSVGFVLNKNLDVSLQEAVMDFPSFDAPLYVGGPVENESLFYIHTLGNKLEGAVHLFENLYWGGDFTQLKQLINLKQITSEEIRFFAGYSGWGKGQLRKEMRQRSWIVSDATTETVMNVDTDLLWKEALSKLGKGFAKMAGFPADPSLN